MGDFWKVAVNPPKSDNRIKQTYYTSFWGNIGMKKWSLFFLFRHPKCHFLAHENGHFCQTSQKDSLTRKVRPAFQLGRIALLLISKIIALFNISTLVMLNNVPNLGITQGVLNERVTHTETKELAVILKKCTLPELSRMKTSWMLKIWFGLESWRQLVAWGGDGPMA